MTTMENKTNSNLEEKLSQLLKKNDEFVEFSQKRDNIELALKNRREEIINKVEKDLEHLVPILESLEIESLLVYQSTEGKYFKDSAKYFKKQDNYKLTISASSEYSVVKEFSKNWDTIYEELINDLENRLNEKIDCVLTNIEEHSNSIKELGVSKVIEESNEIVFGKNVNHTLDFAPEETQEAPSLSKEEKEDEDEEFII